MLESRQRCTHVALSSRGSLVENRIKPMMRKGRDMNKSGLR